MGKSDVDAWAFLEDMAEKTMQWETIREDENPKVGVKSIETSIGAEAKLATIMHRLETLELKDKNQVHQISTSFTRL